MATKKESIGPMREIRSTRLTLRSSEDERPDEEPVNKKINLRDFIAHLAQLIASYMPPSAEGTDGAEEGCKGGETGIDEWIQKSLGARGSFLYNGENQYNLHMPGELFLPLRANRHVKQQKVFACFACPFASTMAFTSKGHGHAPTQLLPDETREIIHLPELIGDGNVCVIVHPDYMKYRSALVEVLCFLRNCYFFNSCFILAVFCARDKKIMQISAIAKNEGNASLWKFDCVKFANLCLECGKSMGRTEPLTRHKCDKFDVKNDTGERRWANRKVQEMSATLRYMSLSFL